MKIDYSFLTNNIYVLDGKRKVDMTNEIVTAVQIMLHNKIEFNKLHSKLENKTYKLKLELIE